MSNEKDMITDLIVGLIKRMLHIFLNHMNLLEETLMLKLIYLIMQ